MTKARRYQEAEVWDWIPGWEGWYKASTLGRVRSVKRVIRYKNGNKVLQPGRLLRPAFDKITGYERVNLCRGNRKTCVCLHQAVGRTFLENPENLPEINHKDGNKLNCVVTNLEWTTVLGNKQHAVKMGLIDRKGEKHPMARKTEEDIKEIRTLLSQKVPQSRIAAAFGVTQPYVSKIKLGQRWSHV